MSDSESGYDASLFLENVDKYLCTICKGVWRVPVEIGCPQDHALCQQCYITHIDTWNANHSSVVECPLKCGEQSSDRSKRPNQLISRMVSSLQMHCTNWDSDECIDTEDNCDWTGELINLEYHLSNDCPLEHIHCRHCHQTLARKHMRPHRDECPDRVIKCTTGCGVKLKRRQLKTHLSNDCNRVFVGCRNDGCDTRCTRRRMRLHLLKCEWQMIECPFVKYGCRHKIARCKETEHIQQNMINHLRMKNQWMENKIESLEKGMAELRRHMRLNSSTTDASASARQVTSSASIINVPWMSQFHLPPLPTFASMPSK